MNASMNKGLVCSAVLASVSAGLLTQGALGSGNIVYSQMPPNFLGGLFSDGVAGQYYGQRIADDFTLGSATTVNGVQWAGNSENFYYATLQNFAQFRISIYANAGGLPGGVVLDTYVAVGATNPTYLGVDAYAAAPVYQFEAKFNGLNLAAGTYWLSIGTVNNAAFGDAFVWQNGVTTNNTIAAEFFDGSGFASFAGFGDMAFAIQAGNVPAPGALALLGMAGLIGRRRRS
jgi:MYXO-CTERM domain-containing protein